MVRGHKGLEVRPVFYFYFFPTSCLSEVSHGLPPIIGTIASPLLADAETRRRLNLEF